MFLDTKVYDLLNKLLGSLARELYCSGLDQVRSEHKPGTLIGVTGLYGMYSRYTLSLELLGKGALIGYVWFYTVRTRDGQQ